MPNTAIPVRRLAQLHQCIIKATLPVYPFELDDKWRCAAMETCPAAGPDRVGAWVSDGRRSYLSEVLIEVKLVLMVPPSRLIIAIIASAIPAAIKPYSIAVAPDSSAQNLKKRFNYTSRCCADLVVPRGI